MLSFTLAVNDSSFVIMLAWLGHDGLGKAKPIRIGFLCLLDFTYLLTYSSLTLQDLKPPPKLSTDRVPDPQGCGVLTPVVDPPYPWPVLDREIEDAL